MTPSRSFNVTVGAFIPAASGGLAGVGRGRDGTVGLGWGVLDGCGVRGTDACGSDACGADACGARDADGDSTLPVSSETTSDTGPSVTSMDRCRLSSRYSPA